MNNKALAILIISSIGFMIAILIFYADIGSRRPGPESPYLGHNSVTIFNLYYEAESRLFFLDNSAILAWRNSGNNFERFKQNLQPYMANFNSRYGTDLHVDDYEFLVKDGFLKARTSKKLSLDTSLAHYSFRPNFKVFVGESLKELPSHQSQEEQAEESVSLISE